MWEFRSRILGYTRYDHMNAPTIVHVQGAQREPKILRAFPCIRCYNRTTRALNPPKPPKPSNFVASAVAGSKMGCSDSSLSGLGFGVSSHHPQLPRPKLSSTTPIPQTPNPISKPRLLQSPPPPRKKASTKLCQ